MKYNELVYVVHRPVDASGTIYWQTNKKGET